MITRPLDVASRLRPEPRNFDALFYVNIGLLVLFFDLAGARFVLSPGVDFRLPEVSGARAGALPTTTTLSILDSGQIFTKDGLLPPRQLPEWLREEASHSREPSLLIRAADKVPYDQLANIISLARRAGFAHTVLAANEAAVAAPEVP